MEDPDQADAALRAALTRLIAPLAQLAVARGVSYAVLDEGLRSALVASAHATHPDLPEHRRVSRVSTTTGLNRREVSRLLAGRSQATAGAAPAAPRRSPAAAVFARWLSRAEYRTRSGAPRVLPRTGPAPSFESLAQEVTRDVHPRAILEELVRLKVVAHNGERDTVRLLQQSFVPSGDVDRMLQWLGANVGDHFAGAVANLTGRRPAFADQAIAADGLSAASIAQVRPLLVAHWERITGELAPLLERLIADDASNAGPTRPNHYRVRFGLYGFDDAEPTPAAEEPARSIRKSSRRTMK